MFGIPGAQRFRILRLEENSTDAPYSSHGTRIIRFPMGEGQAGPVIDLSVFRGASFLLAARRPLGPAIDYGHTVRDLRLHLDLLGARGFSRLLCAKFRVFDAANR